jgi:hypothetical protein
MALTQTDFLALSPKQQLTLVGLKGTLLARCWQEPGGGNR